jgi:hypothetical protein
MKTRCILIRTSDDGKQTLGNLLVINAGIDAIFATLEPSWQHNKQRLSCIPWGRYPIRKRWSEKYGWPLHVQDVQGRDWILMHKGNFRDDTTGCILVGYNHADLNGDGAIDVTQSRRAMEALLRLLPDRCTLDIVPVLP